MTAAIIITDKRIEYFEALLDDVGAYANSARSLTYLQALAKRIWATHGRSRQSVPKITIHGPPKQLNGGYLSFSYGRGLIVLHKHSLCVSVLIHELVHTMGYWQHNTSFMRQYIELLELYGKCNPVRLSLQAWAAGFDF